MSLQLSVVRQYADGKGTTLNQYDRVSLSNIKMNYYDNMRQWTWQYCTEFGWFQMAYKAHPMRSRLINETYWVPYCQSIFGNSIGEPAVQYYINRYGGLNITGKNIVFANAIEDPWQYAGMRKLQDPTGTQKDMAAFLINCENCGHCIDLSTPAPADSPGLTLARTKIAKQIKDWLAAADKE